MQEQQTKGQQPQSQNSKCKECGKTLNSAEELREHEKTHQSQGRGQQQNQPQGSGTHKAGGGGA